MPLRKFSDEEFDNLVRTRFESAPMPAYDPAAWSKFNLQKKKAGWIPKVVYVGIISIILTLSGLIVFNRYGVDQNSDLTVAHASVLDIKDETSVVESSSGKNDTYGTTIQDSADVTKSTISKEKEAEVSSNQLTNGAIQNKKTKVRNSIPPNDSNAKFSQQENTPQGSEIKNSSVAVRSTLMMMTDNGSTEHSTDLIAGVGENNEDPVLKNTNKVISDDQTLTTGTLNSDEQVPTLVLASSFSQTGDEIPPKDFEEKRFFVGQVPEMVTLVQEPVVPEKDQKIANRFMFGLVLNTDLTTINLKNFTGPGSGIGVRGAYQFTDRLSLITGVNRVNKVYLVTDEGDVTLPPGVWDNNNFPDQIDAKCTVIEIPINVRFDLIKLPKGRIYGLAGLNSFLMNRELYEWEVSNSIYGSLTDDIDIRKENKHYFGVLNLSAGYQRRVNEHFSWGIETYYQSTLAGVGFYEVSLKSLGNQILINYHF